MHDQFNEQPVLLDSDQDPERGRQEDHEGPTQGGGLDVEDQPDDVKAKVKDDPHVKKQHRVKPAARLLHAHKFDDVMECKYRGNCEAATDQVSADREGPRLAWRPRLSVGRFAEVRQQRH